MIETIELFGVSISLYYTFWFLGAAAVIIGGALRGKHYGYTVSRSAIYVTGTIILGYALMLGASWVIGGGKMVGQNFIRVVILLPIPILLFAKFTHEPFGKIADFLAPFVAIFHGVSHLGCIFPGCCYGFSSDWGLYSNDAGRVCFPIQSVEGLSSILIGTVLLYMQKRNIQNNKLYAWYLLLFGGTRFVYEFFRDNTKIIFNISELALHALAASVIGAAVLVISTCLKKEHE